MDKNHLNVILQIVIIAFRLGVFYKSIKKDMKVKDLIFVVIVIVNS